MDVYSDLNTKLAWLHYVDTVHVDVASRLFSCSVLAVCIINQPLFYTQSKIHVLDHYL